MPKIDVYAQGAPCFAQLYTPDGLNAAEFYSSLLGLDAELRWTENGEYFYALKLNGMSVAAIFTFDEEIIQKGIDIQPEWKIYFNVNNVYESMDAVRRYGGEVKCEPSELNGVLTAICTDNQGGLFSIIQANNYKNIVSEVKNEIGTMCWSHLATLDSGAAVEFYVNALGMKRGKSKKVHSASDSQEYIALRAGGKEVAGVMQVDMIDDDCSSAWNISFGVHRLDEKLVMARMTGAEIFDEIEDVMKIKRQTHGKYYAAIVDPQGAYFGIIKI